MLMLVGPMERVGGISTGMGATVIMGMAIGVVVGVLNAQSAQTVLCVHGALTALNSNRVHPLQRVLYLVVTMVQGLPIIADLMRARVLEHFL